VICADALSVCDELFGTIATKVALTTGDEPCKSGLGRDQDYVPSKAPEEYLANLRQNHGHERTARLVDAGKLRWALADLWATPGFGARLAYAKELILKR
jgi:hypothetical protein